MSLSNGLSCKTGSFSHCHNPHRFLQPAVLRHYFPMLEPWVAQFVCLPNCSSQLIHMQMWDCSLLQPLPCFLSSPPQLPASTPPTSLGECRSLTPWLSDIHAVSFSGSSGCFLFLNWLLSFFWLCEEVKCLYLCLYLGQNPIPQPLYPKI